jgi:hypothetical protein
MRGPRKDGTLRFDPDGRHIRRDGTLRFDEDGRAVRKDGTLRRKHARNASETTTSFAGDKQPTVEVAIVEELTFDEKVKARLSSANAAIQLDESSSDVDTDTSSSSNVSTSDDDTSDDSDASVLPKDAARSDGAGKEALT